MFFSSESETKNEESWIWKMMKQDIKSKISPKEKQTSSQNAVRHSCDQGGITCGAIDEPRKSSKAIDERVNINFRAKNVVIKRFRYKNVVIARFRDKNVVIARF